jgi:hypothetical protein
MEIVHTHCAGLDVHKKTVVPAIIVPDPQGGLRKETRTYGTMTADLLALSDWLMEQCVTHVAMESTGEYTPPIMLPKGCLIGNIQLRSCVSTFAKI